MNAATRAARAQLKAKGWSYRTAAPALGVCYQHIAFVLTGRRSSRRLLAAIADLPAKPSLSHGN